MARDLIVVASCTEGKSVPVPERTRLRSIRSMPLARRLQIWRSRLAGEVQRVRADRLYRGGHWSSVNEVIQYALTKGYDAELWVASAGYGLIPAAMEVAPYSATFATGSRDSVWRPEIQMRRVDANRYWWLGLCQSARRWPGKHLGDVLSKGSCRRVIIVGSSSYIKVMEPELCAVARSSLSNMAIVTGLGGVLDECLSDLRVRSDLRLRRALHLSGPLTSLHARVAGWIVAKMVSDSSDLPSIVSELNELGGRTQPPRKERHRPMSDGQVEEYIRRAQRRAPGVSRTALLRFLREHGRSCEARRFKRLYTRVLRQRARYA